MKAIMMREFGGPDVLKLEEVARPEVAPGKALVRVLTASVNPVDWKIRQGGYPRVHESDLPIIPGRDLAGVVEELGTPAEAFPPGAEVFAFLDMDEGGYGEYAMVDLSELAPKPASLSMAEAAAVPLAGMTAWQGLFDHGELTEGDRVLIHGGAGGVGHFAVQFAKARGAWVAATASSADADFVRSLGADQVIPYDQKRFESEIERVQLVFDLIGGEVRERSFQCVRPGGLLVSTLGEPDKSAAAAHGIRVAGYMATPDGRQLAEIGRLIDAGKVRVEVQRVLPVAEAGKAQKLVEDGPNRGKTVLAIAD